MLREWLVASAIAALCLGLAVPGAAQSPPTQPGPAAAVPPKQDDAIEDVAAQVRELRQALDAVREQLAGSRKESDALREDVRAMREQLDALQRAGGQGGNAAEGEPSLPARVDALIEDQELLRAKVEDQEQTKVESSSKHHVRLSGLALIGVASTRGSVDNLDLPEIAQPRPLGSSGGSFSANVRQSRLGLEVFGPTLGGAATTGAISIDFFGGLPATPDGASSPVIRLRTATMALDWARTSVVTGQDVPFFSPRSPTSLASTAYPALSAAGNLWAWTTQVHVDHRMALPRASTLLIEWGVLDPLTGEPPPHEYDRVPTAGERTWIPAQAVRAEWLRGAGTRSVAFAGGAYHAKQDWGFGRTIDAWAATADWDVTLNRWIALSGELYRGRAIGGLGGGANESVVFDGIPTDPASSVRPVDTAGGWAQVKVKAGARLEFNGAFGKDSPFRSGLGQFAPVGSTGGPQLNRNTSGFVNAIYQARSNLLFSIEYRRLWTAGLNAATSTADHVSVSTGIVF